MSRQKMLRVNWKIKFGKKECKKPATVIFCRETIASKDVHHTVIVFSCFKDPKTIGNELTLPHSYRICCSGLISSHYKLLLKFRLYYITVCIMSLARIACYPRSQFFDNKR